VTIGGTTYGLVVLLSYFFMRAQLRTIVFGLAPSGNRLL